MLDTVAEHHRVLSLNPGDREAPGDRAAPVPHVEGQRPHGRADRARRCSRGRGRASRQPADRGRAARHAGGADDDRRRRKKLPRLGRRAVPLRHRVAPDAHALLQAAISRRAARMAGRREDSAARRATESKSDVAAPAIAAAGWPKSIEMPELGIADHDDAPRSSVEDAPPAVEMIDVVVPQENRITPPVLKLVADNTTSRGTAWPEIDTRAAPSPQARPAEITIGAATLSTTLWNVLCDEAEAHVATTLPASCRCCNSIRDFSHRRKWCVRATRCAAFIAPADSRRSRRRRTRSSKR